METNNTDKTLQNLFNNFMNHMQTAFRPLEQNQFKDDQKSNHESRKSQTSLHPNIQQTNISVTQDYYENANNSSKIYTESSRTNLNSAQFSELQLNTLNIDSSLNSPNSRTIQYLNLKTGDSDLYRITSLHEFVRKNSPFSLQNSLQNKYLIELNTSTENTFFKSVIIIHFKHLLYNDYIDIYNHSLFDLFERVKNKKIVLKANVMKNYTEEQIQETFCHHIYNLIKLKTMVSKSVLFKAFLMMIWNDQIFLESLILMMKELIIEMCDKSEDTDPQIKNLIQQNWIEIKPELVSLLSQTLNKQIEILYLLDTKSETCLYDRVKTRYNSDTTKINVVYWHNVSERKSYYYSVVDLEERDIFDKVSTVTLEQLGIQDTIKLYPNKDINNTQDNIKNNNISEIMKNNAMIQEAMRTEVKKQEVVNPDVQKYEVLKSDIKNYEVMKSDVQKYEMKPELIKQDSIKITLNKENISSSGISSGIQDVIKVNINDNAVNPMQQLIKDSNDKIKQEKSDSKNSTNTNNTNNPNTIKLNNLSFLYKDKVNSFIGDCYTPRLSVPNKDENRKTELFANQSNKNLPLNTKPLVQQQNLDWNRVLILSKVKDLMYMCTLNSQKLNEMGKQNQQKIVNHTHKENMIPKYQTAAPTHQIPKTNVQTPMRIQTQNTLQTQNRLATNPSLDNSRIAVQHKTIYTPYTPNQIKL